MSILKVNDIRRATTGSSTLVFNDPVTITSGTISASVLIGSLPGGVTFGDGTIGKEKLTNDARDFVNILNKPVGLVTSSAQVAAAISGTFITPAGVTASSTIFTSGSFSGSGAGLSSIPNAALTNNTITINGTSVALGASRTLTTADISESGNLYYTDTRVKAKLSAEAVVSSSGQINYQSVTGQPSVNTLGTDGNKTFTITAGIFITGSTGIDVSTDAPNAKITLKTVGGTVSSSAQVAANLPANTVSASAQVKTFLPDGTVSASSQYAGWVTASSQIDYNNIQNKLSGVVSASAQVKPLLPADTVTSSTQVKTFLPDGTVSSSTQYPGWITSSTQVVNSLPIGTVSSSAQQPGWVTASSQIDVRNTIGITTIATTGSNTFVGNQIMSGSVTVTGNLNILGSSSIVYTSASELIVGDNKIIVNSTDLLRFAGLQIIDSGSISPTTASLYWDGLNHKFIYENLSGSNYNSAIFLAGPKNTGVLGNEPVLTTGRIPVATGDVHLDNRTPSSSIRVDFTTLRTDIEAGLYITGSTTASGHIVPATTDTYDLGSPTLKFRSLYLSGSTLYLGTLALSDVGGALTISPSGSPAAISPVSGAFTGSFRGNGSQLTNIANAALPAGIISSSAQLPIGTVSSSAQYPGWVTASSQIDYNSITNKLSGVISSSTQIAVNLPAGTISSSGQVTATSTTGFTGSVEQILKDNTVHSGSYLGTATTNNLSEGFTNLYYTDARVKTKLSVENVHSGSYLGTATTTNLIEGANLYFTNPRVIAALPTNTVSSSNQVNTFLPAGTVSSSNQVDLGNAFGTASRALTASFALAVSGTLATNTDGLTEGSTNLYYTDARVKTKLNVENVHSGSFLGTATTTNLTEGTNLYFTNLRVVSALPVGTVSSSAQLVGSGIVSSSAQIVPLLPVGTVSQSAGTITVDGTNSIIGINTTSPSTLTKLHVNGALMVENGVTSTNAFKDGIIFTYTGGSSQYRHKIATRHDSIAALNLMEFLVATGASTSASILTLNGTNPSSFYKGLNVTGSFTVQGSISGALVLPADTVSSSTQVKTFLPSSTVSSSAQVAPLLPGGTVSSSGQVDITATTNYSTFSSSIATKNNVQDVSITALNTATSSYAINSTIQSQLAGVVSSSTQVAPLLPGSTVSSSAQAVAAISGQYIVPSGSNFQGIVSGSGTAYRLVVPVGTNLYAT